MNADLDVINGRFAVVADLLDIPEPARAEAVAWLVERDPIDAAEAIAIRHGIGCGFLLTGQGRALRSNVERRSGYRRLDPASPP